MDRQTRGKGRAHTHSRTVAARLVWRVVVCLVWVVAQVGVLLRRVGAWCAGEWDTHAPGR